MRKIYASFILLLLFLCSCSESSTVTPENCTHNFQAVAIIKQATCTENGSGKVVCTRCGKEDVQELHAIGHVERILSYVAPTCSAAGLELGSVCSVCRTVLIPQKEIPKLSHVEEIMPAVQSTCNREGLTEGKRCSLCKEVLVSQIKISKLSHVEQEAFAAVPATCTESGSTALIRCAVCKQTLKAQKTISAKGHNYSDWTTVVAATCVSDGEKQRSCSVCGETEIQTIKANSNDHKYSEWTTAIASTCISEGSCTRYCIECGSTETAILAVTYHNLQSGQCTTCGFRDPDYVHIFSAGETFKVNGEFEITINSVTRHNLCNNNYYNKINATTSVIIDYTYKNLGSDKLEITHWNFEVYDSHGTEGDSNYFQISCDHGTETQSVIYGGSCTVNLPVALTNDGEYVTIFFEKNNYTATFKIKVTEFVDAESESGVSGNSNTSYNTYGRVYGQLTYQYNKFVGTRGDNGAKVMLIPKNKNVKNYDNSGASSLLTGTYDSGIIVTRCDGYGNFDFGNIVPTGEYIFLAVSKNTTSGARFQNKDKWESDIYQVLGSYFSEQDMEKLYLFLGFSSLSYDHITIEQYDSIKLTCDFGYSYS